jgi:hypothetical protein
MPNPDSITAFIDRWSQAEAAERANYALFLSELCDVLGVPRPDPSGRDTALNTYVFERAVTFHHRGTDKTTTGHIDLYKRGCFVLEAKQYAAVSGESADLALGLLELGSSPPRRGVIRGSAAWDRAMLEALGQADRYARSLPADEDPPPFLLVVDVGHVIELHADFTQKGKNYQPFPDARSHRLRLADLARAEVRDLLRAVWTDPVSLDPSKKAAAVTREVAGYLAELAKSFEKQHDPRLVAEFLSRCLFCMFAEDVGLLPKEGFKGFLDSIKDDPRAFVPLAEQLFADMNEGRVSGLLRKKLLHFNGGLFSAARALPVNGTQLGLLRRAAALEWRHVEPAIFGTLLERALSPDERHKLGAHYTPRAYVERLVLPTLLEPLREEWSGIRIAAVTLAQRDTVADLKKARAAVREFHDRLCAVRVLDPACGSGNFLYVALEQMKRLEGEVIALLRDLGETDVLALQGVTVDPHQFLGLEVNPRAAAIAELVLWIGYLQWHFRVHGNAAPAEPVLRKFNNIECRDAVLAWDERGFLATDGTFCPVDKINAATLRYVWDRKTYKTDPVTGREVPDEKAVVALEAFRNPRPAAWPQADFIVGNPPFIGARTIRPSLGDGYLDALRSSYPAIPENADFVMYWWYKAAELVRAKQAARFGFITTNSITQSFNRGVVAPQLQAQPRLNIVFAIPDHPWVDSGDGAAVRIAMTVAISNPHEGTLRKVLKESRGDQEGADVVFEEQSGCIEAQLTIGTDAFEPVELQANANLCCVGYQLTGTGFTVDAAKHKELLSQDGNILNRHCFPLLSARDVTQSPRGLWAIDLYGFDAAAARAALPATMHVITATVKPERDHNPRATVRQRWWIYGEARSTFRPALIGLKRLVVAPLTSSHRLFIFAPQGTVADSTTVMFAFDDGFFLGVLSSAIHVVFSLAAGGRLGVGNDPRYNKTRCFDPFPFPDCTEKQKERIRQLAEELDAHRKRAQAAHQLGLTDIYNVLEKLRAGEALSAKDKTVHDAALVSTLKQLHDDLDRAVADAYGWPWPLTDAEILERVVALNAARSAEEAKGHIRWLRPDYQQPLFAGTQQTALGLQDSSQTRKPRPRTPAPRRPGKAPWPKTLAERAKAVEAALQAAEKPLSAADLAKQFARAKEKEIAEILETLAALARAHPGDTKGTYVR